MKAGCKYVLIGRGRWGSADRWLGIPVDWTGHLGSSAVSAQPTKLNAEPSGFPLLIISFRWGINYLTVDRNQGDRIDWQWLTSLPLTAETPFVARVPSTPP